MRNDKNAAMKLRLSGKSYSEIQKILNVPKSTLSGWFSQVILSDNLRKQIEKRARKKSIEGLLRRNKNQTTLAQKRALDIRNAAGKNVSVLTSRDLFILGVALYWAEGYKRLIVRNGKERTFHPVSLTNSDSFIVKSFLRFLREYCAVPEEKIKASIRIFRHQNENTLLQYWHKETGIPIERFRKTYYGISRSSQGKRPFNQLPHGVIQIVVADTKLFHAIMGYIEGIKKFI